MAISSAILRLPFIVDGYLWWSNTVPERRSLLRLLRAVAGKRPFSRSKFLAMSSMISF